MESNKEILMVQKHKEDFIQSFAEAIRSVGGNPSVFLRGDLTLDEMMDSLAQNGVRFCAIKKANVDKRESIKTGRDCYE